VTDSLRIKWQKFEMKRKIEADKYIEREICNNLKVISLYCTSRNSLIDTVILETMPIIFQYLLKKPWAVLLRSSRSYRMVEVQQTCKKTESTFSRIP